MARHNKQINKYHFSVHCYKQLNRKAVYKFSNCSLDLIHKVYKQVVCERDLLRQNSFGLDAKQD